MKEARRSERSERMPSGMISNLDTPYGGLISVAYMISGFRNFCQYLTVERHLIARYARFGRDNSGVQPL